MQQNAADMERVAQVLQLLPVDLQPADAVLHHQCHVLAHLQPGDHIAVPIGLALPGRDPARAPWHHGIYLGDGKVMHMHGESKEDARVRQDDMSGFLGSGGYKYVAIVQYSAGASAAHNATLELARRLEAAPSGAVYDLLCCNCECFATFCKTGRCADYVVGMACLQRLVLTAEPPTKPAVCLRAGRTRIRLSR